MNNPQLVQSYIYAILSRDLYIGDYELTLCTFGDHKIVRECIKGFLAAAEQRN